MARYQKRKKRRKPRPLKDCSFCKSKTEPDYKETEVLTRFLTDRGKIVARARSGACARHQRKLAREVKRARYLALLPFLTKPEG